MRIFRINLYILFCVMLSACGFHLRGSLKFPAQIKSLYLQSSNYYSQFNRDLKIALNYSGMRVAENVNDAVVVLDILDNKLKIQQIGIGSSQQIRDYAATYIVVYTVKNRSGKVIFGPKTISSQETVTMLQNEIITNSSKVINVKNGLRGKVINGVILQLASKQFYEKLKQISY